MTTYRELMEALKELSDEQLNEKAVIVKDREVYEIEDCRLVWSIDDPLLKDKLESQYNLHESYPVLMI